MCFSSLVEGGGSDLRLLEERVWTVYINVFALECVLVASWKVVGVTLECWRRGFEQSVLMSLR